MKKWLLLFAVLLSIPAYIGHARADDDKKARQFATLPDGVRFPERIKLPDLDK